jgi:hypothetical protein
MSSRSVPLVATIGCALLMVSGGAWARDITVANNPNSHPNNPHPDYTSIQAAVNHANPGDTIHVFPGIYKEQVTVTVPNLTIKAEGANDPAQGRDLDLIPNQVDEVVIYVFQKPYGVYLNADNDTLEGPDVAYADGPGVMTSATHSGYKIDKTFMINNSVGLYLNNNATQPNGQNHLNQTEITHNGFWQNVETGFASGTGLYSDSLFFAKIHENFTAFNPVSAMNFNGKNYQAFDDVENNQTFNDGPIVLTRMGYSQLKNNYSSIPVTNGISVEGGVVNTEIANNTVVYAAGDGITIADNPNPGPNINLNVHDNKLLGVAKNGISLVGSNGQNIQNNDIEFPGRDGIYLTKATFNWVQNNHVKNAGLDGIATDPPSVFNVFMNNEMRNSGGFDAHDTSVGGGTAGTDNLWINNHGDTSNPPGLVMH